jgi:hypothetical protein
MRKKQKITLTISVPEQDGDETIYHILPDAVNGGITLCGWCDVPCIIHDADEHPPNCPMCIRIVKYCQSLEDMH